jgi:hypothetical protein
MEHADAAKGFVSIFPKCGRHQPDHVPDSVLLYLKARLRSLLSSRRCAYSLPLRADEAARKTHKDTDNFFCHGMKTP